MPNAPLLNEEGAGGGGISSKTVSLPRVFLKQIHYRIGLMLYFQVHLASPPRVALYYFRRFRCVLFRKDYT
jgi:hypothetical protein